MNEDFNPNGIQEVDELFRDALNGYSTSPSDAAWGKLNSKLNFKEVHDFVTFKKPPASSRSWPQPLYRMQWFRGIIAGLVGTVIIASVVLLVNNLSSPNDTHGALISDSNSVSPVQPDNAINSTKVDPGQYSTTDVAVPLVPLASNDRSSASTVPPRQNAPADSPISFTMLDMTLPQAITERVTPATADNPNPEVMNHRFQEALRVDSLIHAAVMRDSLQMLIDDFNAGMTEEALAVNETESEEPQARTNEFNPIVPNAFTPNGDGLNDYFYVANLERYPENQLMIQDRSGRVVVNVKNYKGDWNAFGEPDGTYFFLFCYKDEQGITQYLKGTVIVLR